MLLRDKIGQEMKEKCQGANDYTVERKRFGYTSTNAATYGGNPAENK